MRQQKVQNTYAELVCVIPGRGLQTLFRGTSYGQALAFRSNNSLRTFRGHKVGVAERRALKPEPTGWLYRDETKWEAHTLW